MVTFIIAMFCFPFFILSVILQIIADKNKTKEQKDKENQERIKRNKKEDKYYNDWGYIDYSGKD